MKFCFQLTGRICNVAFFSHVFNGDRIFPRFLFFYLWIFYLRIFYFWRATAFNLWFSYIFFLRRIVVFPFLSSHFLTCECFPFEFFTRGSFTSGEPPLFTYVFLHMILFTCVKFTFFTCECFTCGFFLVESHHFYMWFLLLLDFVLVDLYLGLLCVHLVFYFWFFRPKIGPKRGRIKLCCSKIIDWHPSKYCFIFRLALYLHFTPSGKVPKIYF